MELSLRDWDQGSGHNMGIKVQPVMSPSLTSDQGSECGNRITGLSVTLGLGLSPHMRTQLGRWDQGSVDDIRGSSL